MKKSLALLTLGVLACAILAFCLWLTPQKSQNVPAPGSSELSLVASNDAPAPVVHAVATPIAFNITRSEGTLFALMLASGIAVLIVAQRYSKRGRLIAAVNTLPASVGSSKHSRRYLATAAIAVPAPYPASNQRGALVKKGADDEHAAIVAAASDEPIGATTDEAAAAEDPITVELFGVSCRTLPMVAKAAIAIGADVYSDGTGKVTVKPTAAGTYWRVGKAMTAAGADGDPIEVMPIKPRKLIVVAALTQTSNATLAGLAVSNPPTQAEVQAIRTEAGKLQADFYVLSAALSGDADVTVATT